MISENFKRVLGATLLLGALGFIFYLTAAKHGLWCAAQVWLGALGLSGVIVAGVMLLVR